MSFVSYLAHKAIQFYQKSSHERFAKNLSRIEDVQKAKLQSTLSYLSAILKNRMPTSTYEEFIAQYPVTSYSDYQNFFLEEKKSTQKKLPEVVRFQPTSGSTNSVKWIPYTSQLLKDFDAALGPWLYDFYRRQPAILNGPHYWSLSWLPQDLRDEGVRLDDTELFPIWKRILLKQTMAVMAPVDLAKTSESSLFATLAFLIDRKSLSFASVWSPTYWLNLMKLLSQYQQEIAESLRTGTWAHFQNELSLIPCPKNPERAKDLLKTTAPEKLWPNFRAISSWTTSTSSIFAESIKTKWPHIEVFGKGLWATEACVTIPYEGDYVLAVNSHFFEFEDITSGQIHPAWDLKLHQVVSPIVTTTGGLIRYKMQDAMKVTGFNQSTPCFEFLGRADGVDMVGEKTSTLRAQEIISSFTNQGYEGFLFAVKGSPSHYCAVLDANTPRSSTELSTLLEEKLSESFHYRLARELGQLGKAQVRLIKKPIDSYIRLHLNRGMVLGNIKAESLRLITEEELKDCFVCN